MELILILRVVLRRWYLIVIPVAIVAVFALPNLLQDSSATSGGFSTIMRYTAGQELEAIPNRDGDYQDVWLASELTVNAFTEWVRTFSFAQEVAQVTAGNGLEIDPAVLAITADNERSIGQIFLSWRNADELQIIADAATEVLQTHNQAYFPQLGDAPAEVVWLDEARISPAPPSLPNRFRPLIQLAVAFIGGIGLAFVIDYLDPTIYHRDDVEAIGVRVIGTISRR